MKLEIKTENKKDTEGITKLYRELYKGDEEQVFFKSIADPSYFNSGSKVLIAKKGKNIVGFIWIVYYEHIKNKGVGIIEELYVDTAYRRQGIGRILVKKALEYLKGHVTVVVVTTGEEMKGTQEFYRALGFKLSKEWFYINNI